MINCSGQKHSRQLQSISEWREQANSALFFSVLSDDAMSDKLNSLMPEYRERLYTPTDTLSMFMSQALNSDRSCQHVVNEWFANRLGSNLGTISTNTGAYCRARQRLPENMISEWVRHSGNELQRRVPEKWQWKGRSVKLVDGTTLSMPDTAQNQAAYPQPKTQKMGVGFPQCRLVGVLDLSSGGVCDVAYGACKGKGSGEQSLLRRLLGSLNTGDVLLGDALYPSYFLLCELQTMGIDCLFEQMGARARGTDFRKGKSLGPRDHLIIYNKPEVKPEWLTQNDYDEAPETLCVRELRFSVCKGKKGKTLVSTMCCPKADKKAALKQLYKQRWHVELNFRHIKTTLGMDVLSCRTPEMIGKEIWVCLLAYNLIRILMAQAAIQADRIPNTLSFKHCTQLWLAWRRQGLLSTGDHWTELLIAMAQKRVGNRPNRTEPRQRKRRPKPFPLLQKSRQQARQDVIKNGHEAKLAA